MTDPAIWLLVGLVVLAVFAVGVMGLRRARLDGPRLPEERLRAVEGRLGHVEAQLDLTQSDVKKTKHDVGNMRMLMQTLPTAKDVSEVMLQVAELKGKVEGIGDRIHTVQSSCARIEDFLMKAAAEGVVRGRAGGAGS